jgi:D-amino peptidase
MLSSTTAALASNPPVTPAAATATLAVRWQSASVAAQLLAVSGPLPGLYRLFGVFMRVATALTNQPPYC